jgi:hypothetical protein
MCIREERCRVPMRYQVAVEVVGRPEDRDEDELIAAARIVIEDRASEPRVIEAANDILDRLRKKRWSEDPSPCLSSEQAVPKDLLNRIIH